MKLISATTLLCCLLFGLVKESCGEEFDLEKVLKQITPELPAVTHTENTGEFGRFRRSRILSASEEKSLIDENNNFEGNLDDDEPSKKSDVGKVPDLGSKDTSDKDVTKSTVPDDGGKDKTSKNAGKKSESGKTNSDNADSDEVADKSLKANKDLPSVTNASKGSSISKKSSSGDGSPKSRSDIVMFSQKPVEKAGPSINETTSTLDFAKVAKEISATNDTKSNRRYEVPREESGSGYQSGSGSASDETPVTKSKISRNRVYLKHHQKHSDISVNEAAFMTHLNPLSSGSGSGSDEEDSEGESGSGAGVTRSLHAHKLQSHKHNDSQDETASTRSEHSYVKMSHKINDSDKTQENDASSKTDKYYVNLSQNASEINVESPTGSKPSRSIDQKGAKRTYNSAANVTAPQQNATATPSNTSYIASNNSMTPLNTSAISSNSSAMPLNTSSIASNTSALSPAISPNSSTVTSNTRTIPANVSSIPINQSTINTTTAAKFTPLNIDVVQNVSSQNNNTTVQKKEEINSNLSRIVEKNTSAAILDTKNNTQLQNVTKMLTKDNNTLQAAGVKPTEIADNVTTSPQLSAMDYNTLIQGMPVPTNETQKNSTNSSTSTGTSNSELLESTDEIMSYVNNQPADRKSVV